MSTNTSTSGNHPYDGTTLKALRERVAKAAGPDREIDALICQALLPDLSGANYGRPGLVVDMAAPSVLGGGQIAEAPPLTASIDAALGLVERVLPGRTYHMDATYPEAGIDWVIFGHGKGTARSGTEKPLGPAIARAILLALLDALIALGTKPDIMQGGDAGTDDGGPQ